MRVYYANSIGKSTTNRHHQPLLLPSTGHNCVTAFHFRLQQEVSESEDAERIEVADGNAE